MYKQCLLRRGGSHIIEWIPERGAKVGARVELLPEKEFWEVEVVYHFAISEKNLREHQILHRNSLPSIVES